jgi:hypothetical protein
MDEALRSALQDLCRASLSPRVREGIFSRLSGFGLDMDEASRQAFEESLLEGAPDDFARAWAFHQPEDSRLPLAQQAEAIATRVVVDGASSRFPEALRANGAEVIRASAEAEAHSGPLSSLLDERGLTPAQAAERMGVGDWSQILRNWDHDRFQRTGSGGEVFRYELAGSLRRAVGSESHPTAARI